MYATSACFVTFPLPSLDGSSTRVEDSGAQYYEFRAALMVKNDEGLTKTYNRFHDRRETSPEIARLRELHAQMDRAVLDAYGWQNIALEYDFHLQLDENERYVWSEDTRDEVLARLLEENQKRAAVELAEGEARKKAAGETPPKARGSAKNKKIESGQLSLKGSE